MDTELDIQMQLLASRRRLKKEMQAAISCISPSSKRRLVARWKEEYSDLVYQELLRCAKSKEVSRAIANWELEQFDQKRSK